MLIRYFLIVFIFIAFLEAKSISANKIDPDKNILQVAAFSEKKGLYKFLKMYKEYDIFLDITKKFYFVYIVNIDDSDKDRVLRVFKKFDKNAYYRHDISKLLPKKKRSKVEQNTKIKEEKKVKVQAKPKEIVKPKVQVKPKEKIEPKKNNNKELSKMLESKPRSFERKPISNKPAFYLEDTYDYLKKSYVQ